MKLFSNTKVAIVSMAFVGVAMAGAPNHEEPGKTSAFKQETVKQAPVKQEVVKQSPVKQEVVKQAPVKQEVVKQAPVKQEVVKQAPVKQQPGKQEPTKPAIVAGEPRNAGGEVARDEKLIVLFAVLHHHHQSVQKACEMAQSNSESAVVKAFALAEAKGHADSDAKLILAAEKFGITLRDLDRNSRMGKALLARTAGQMELLKSLSGDAWDQEFLTRQVSCHSHIVRSLQRRDSLATTPEMKSFFKDLYTIENTDRIASQKLLNEVSDDDKLALD